jgi:hypothetical protein
VRRPFVHVAELAPDPGADLHAPGGAITEELCGSLDHEPPCPVASHYTSAERRPDGTVYVRVLFAAEPDDEDAVRARVDGALSRSWSLVASRPDTLRDGEVEHATRLVAS